MFDQNRQIIIITTYGELLEVFKAALEESGLISATQTQMTPILPKEVTLRIAKKMLVEKGYHVKSHTSSSKILAGVSRRMRGREYWYDVSEIQAIPSRL